MVVRKSLSAAGLLLVVLSGGVRAAGHEVEQKDKAFSVATLTIRSGDTIVFINRDQVTHNVFSTAKGNEFNLRAQAPGTSASMKLNGEGTIVVRCAFHPKMKLIVAVKK
jgi:plastocyanin